MRGLGLGYDALSAASPGLIYLAATGFGGDGPYAQLAGLDIIAQAMSGLMSITGEPGAPPVKVGVPIADLTCALYGTIAVLAALRARERDGAGQFIDVSLLESAVSLGVWEAGRYFATGEVPQPSGSAHQAIAPYQAVRSADGWFTFGVTSQLHWTRACAIFGLDAMATDARFLTNELRLAHRPALIDAIEAATSLQPSDTLDGALERGGCTVPDRFRRSIVSSPTRISPNARSSSMHRTARSATCARSARRCASVATPTRIERAGPLLGGDTAEVLREIGVAEDELARLAVDGIAVLA